MPACTHVVRLRALQAGLSARGFAVERLNTYNTVPVQSLPAADLATATAAQVVAFASPSAVKAWLECAGSQAAADMAIACIGAGAPSQHDVHCESLCLVPLAVFLCMSQENEVLRRQHIRTGGGEVGPEAGVLFREPRIGWVCGLHPRSPGSVHSSECPRIVQLWTPAGGVSRFVS